MNKTTFFIPKADNYLLAILNSRVIKFYLTLIVSKMRGGYFMMSKIYMEQIPVPYPSEKDLNFLNNRVSEILRIKKDDISADTSALEAEIDQLVYQLYGLTEEEIQLVEESVR